MYNVTLKYVTPSHAITFKHILKLVSNWPLQNFSWRPLFLTPVSFSTSTSMFREIGLYSVYPHNICGFLYFCGLRHSAVVWSTALQGGSSRIRFPMGSLRFLIDLILPVAHGRGVGSTSKRKQYQGYLLGGKGGRFVELTTLPPWCSDGLEILGTSTSWSPKGPSRVVQG
jgi:hypothetical protein